MQEKRRQHELGMLNKWTSKVRWSISASSKNGEIKSDEIHQTEPLFDTM